MDERQAAAAHHGFFDRGPIAHGGVYRAPQRLALSERRHHRRQHVHAQEQPAPQLQQKLPRLEPNQQGLSHEGRDSQRAGTEVIEAAERERARRIARVEALEVIRLQQCADAVMRLRAETARNIGLDDGNAGAFGQSDEPSSILLVDGRANSQERIARTLKPIAEITAQSDPQAAVFEAAEGSFVW